MVAPRIWPLVTYQGERVRLDWAAISLRGLPHGVDEREIERLGCVCVAEHHPAVLEPQAHHLWPKYLGGPEHPDTLLMLCANTHTNAHRILRRHVKAGQVTPRQKGEPRYSYTVASLGFEAWNAAGRPTS